MTRAESATFEATRRDDDEFIAAAICGSAPSTRAWTRRRDVPAHFYNQAISHNDIRGVAHGMGNAAVRPDRDHEHGTWRIQHKQARKNPVPNLETATSLELTTALGHPNAWVRLTAHRLLSERNDRTVTPALASLLTNRVTYARLHALWTLHALNSLSESNLITAINDPHPTVQNNALRVVPELRSAPSSNVFAAIIKTKDVSERTRLDTVLALTQWTPNKDVISAVHKLFSTLKD